MTAVDWRAYFAEREAQDLAEFEGFLRIPSISTMPEYAGEVRKAAEWVVARMKKAGIPEVELLETGGHPLIYGRWHVDDGKPTVMIYAHYDVQPPDPLEQWISEPFEPQIRDGNIYARGVADDKGGLFATLLAVEALGKTAGGPPVNLVFFYEGEEESGSPSVTPFLEREAARWTCDVVVSADGLMWDEDNYSLVLSSKGMAGGQIDIFTADIDAHSGIYGATVHNAADVTARIAASFHDANGKIAVQGFYDEVLPVTEQQVAEIQAIPFDETEFIGRLGAKATWGEPDYSTLERAWLRPTLDINGIWSGYLGDGGKTVTPSQGHIKFTCRLVPDQNPQAILELIRMHVQTHLPAGCRAEFQMKIGTAQPFSIDRDNPFLIAAEETLRELAGKDPVYGRTGGTIPIAEVFKKHLGAEMVFFAFGLEACNAHAPNEWLRLQDFRTGPIATIMYLQKMGEIPAEAYR